MKRIAIIASLLLPIGGTACGQGKTPPRDFPPAPPQEIDAGPLPPDASLEGPPSARLGEMIVMRADRVSNVDFCEWSVEPEPASMEVIDITAGRGKAKRVVGIGQELHWSSTSVGVYVVTMSIAGPGGLRNVKRRVAYGTIVDDNVLAPAAENVSMDMDGSLETALVRSIRSVRTGQKDSERLMIADGFKQVAEQIKRQNVATPREMTLTLRRVLTNKLGVAYSHWVPAFDIFSHGIFESAEAGLLSQPNGQPDMDRHREALEAAAEIFSE